jgi:hypothetical protein
MFRKPFHGTVAREQFPRNRSMEPLCESRSPGTVPWNRSMEPLRENYSPKRKRAARPSPAALTVCTGPPGGRGARARPSGAKD